MEVKPDQCLSEPKTANFIPHKKVSAAADIIIKKHKAKQMFTSGQVETTESDKPDVVALQKTYVTGALGLKGGTSFGKLGPGSYYNYQHIINGA